MGTVGSGSVTSLPADTLRWAARAIGSRTRVQNVRRLAGSTSSALYALDILDGTARLPCVLRVYDNADWLTEEPDVPRREAAALARVTAAGLTAPALLACDPDGMQSGGISCLLMTRLPGEVVLAPDDLNQWLYGLAEALLPLHALPADDFPWDYQPYADLSTLTPPTWSRVPQLWEQALALSLTPPPPAPPCFIHRDYHPNNVLWRDGRVSGIVDWPSACVGDASVDVAWCRKNLMYLHGIEASDTFLRAYEAVAGQAFPFHPYWDVMVLLEELPGPPCPYPPWAEFGVRVTAEAMRGRVDDYLEGVMRRL